MSQLLSSELALGQDIPLLLYGTAWKEDKTASLTATALKHGFMGIDTANHPTGYNERLVGEGIAVALASGLKREDLFIQSKFSPTFTHHPAKIPYNADQNIVSQVKESVQQTFNNLRLEYLDALLLHAPYPDGNNSLAVWQVLESYVPAKIHYLGISNATLAQLQQIYESVIIKPVIVQNRFYRETLYDSEIRSFCKDHGIVYQAFWMLSHNPDLLNSDVVDSVARKLDKEREVALYVLILCLGDVQVLNGTTKTERMDTDLKAVTELGKEDGNLAKELQPFVAEFKRLMWKLACEFEGPKPTLSTER